MSQDTHETALTRFVESGSIRFAYRRFGRSGGPVLLLLNYFAANLDNLDPKVTNGLAADHDVILVDYPGIGGSSGQTPSTVATLTTDCVAFCRALNLARFDVAGFSLGGMSRSSSGRNIRRWSDALFCSAQGHAVAKEWSSTNSRLTSWTLKPACS